MMVLAQAPDAAATEAQVAKRLFQQGRVEEAIPHFERAVELRQKDPTGWYNLAFANRKAGHFAEAARAYDRYVQLAPDDPDGYFGLAETLRQTGRTAEARTAYETYLTKETRPSEEKWKAVARQRVAELGPAQAAPAAPQDPAVQRPDAAALIARGDKALAANDLRAALNAYQDAVMADGKSVAARVKLGNVYARMGHSAEAAEQWNRALQLDPGNAEARAGLQELQPKAEPAVAPRRDEAAVAPVRRDEAAAKAHYTRGVALENDRKYQEALSELDLAVAQKPGFAIALIARGSARVALGQYEAAAADYRAAQEADPSLAAPLFGLAEAYRALGQTEKAAAFYRQYAASAATDAQPRLKQYALDNAQALAPR